MIICNNINVFLNNLLFNISIGTIALYIYKHYIYNTRCRVMYKVCY